MKLTKRNLSLIYKATLIILCSLGIVMNFMYLKQPFYMTISYYTIQSNIACLIVIILFFVKELRNSPLTEGQIRLKAGFTVMIFLTFLVYHFLLTPFLESLDIDYQFLQFSDVLVHYVSPLMVLGDYLLFSEHRLIRKKDPFVWLLIPLTYWIYTLIYAALGGIFRLGESVSSYPYYFLDIDTYGFLGILPWIGLIMGVYIGLGYGLYGLDYLLGKIRHKEKYERE